jgi:excisionase family DNA binding protein
MQKLLDYEEAAELLHIAPQTLRRWVSTGRVPYHKIGKAVRFSERHLEEILERSEHRATAGVKQGGRNA